MPTTVRIVPSTDWPAHLTTHRSTLDQIEARMRNGGVDDGTLRLFEVLEHWRANSPSDVWSELSQTLIREHPIMDVVLGDPITRRAFEQPRGYAGDAELLDLFYGLANPHHYRDCSARDLSVSEIVATRGAAAAVRDRRSRIAALVDRIAERVDRPRVLSVAAGHLREAELSQAARAGELAEWIALDQDEESLRLVQQQYGHLGVTTWPGSIDDILKGKASFSGLDCVYSAGLYDYLNERLAQRLTACLFESLRPGGTLLLANFLRGISDAGFMEACMRWSLIDRDADDMRGLLDEIPSTDVDRASVYHDTEGQLVYLEVTKR